MGASYLADPMIFLIDTGFSLYIMAVMLRFLLQWVGADYYNPISQFLVKITHPPLRLLRRVIPALGKVDLASLVLMLGLQLLAGVLVNAAQQVSISFTSLLLIAIGQLLALLLNMLMFLIIVRAILSWVAPRTYNPATTLLFSLTEPSMKYVRRFLPPISGVDLSPLVLLIGLQFAKMLVLPPIMQAAGLFN